jgi:hypothetical protein
MLPVRLFKHQIDSRIPSNREGWILIVPPCCRWVIAFGVAFAMAPTFVLADVQVRGNPQNVHVEAKDTSLEEILAGLENALNVRHRSATKLDKRLNGTYDGSLHSVIKRILEGYDFFLKTEDGETAVTVLGPSTTALGTAASFTLRISDRPIEVGPSQRPPTPAAAEPQVPTAPPAAIPAQLPPALAAVEPRVRTASAAAWFRRRPRNHFVGDEAGSRPPPPRKIKVAGSAWRKSGSHIRSKRFAHSSIFCCGQSGAPLGPGMPVKRSRSWVCWEAWPCAVRFLFDRPRWWWRRQSGRRKTAPCFASPRCVPPGWGGLNISMVASFSG